MYNCVNCSTKIPTKNAMCTYCWHTLSSKTEMYIYVEKQKINGANREVVGR